REHDISAIARPRYGNLTAVALEHEAVAADATGRPLIHVRPRAGGCELALTAVRRPDRGPVRRRVEREARRHRPGHVDHPHVAVAVGGRVDGDAIAGGGDLDVAGVRRAP